ncbi:MAG: permease-like cell division protein FtsX [Desulfitobacterium hafniense]|nr:permease-like cell division protein FtsX [Desulfitobacterium hafniense]
MKSIFSNSGYFLKETLTMLRLNVLSNSLSLLSIGLIFFLLAMVISGWWTSSHVAEVIQSEAEINVFYNENIGDAGVSQLVERIQEIEGVRESRLVNEGEAYTRMEKILGEEARVLEVFNDNPFSPFIEVQINLEKIDPVLKELDHLTGIEHIRNNKDVLDRIRNISGILKLFGFLVVIAVGITTLIIISHIIRQGIHNQREQINTLRLLGAPEFFIAFPFLLEGLLLTVGGGILAVSLAAFTLKQAYDQMAGSLSFIPLLPSEVLVSNMVIVVMTLSAILGMFGSLLGLTLSRNN